MLLSWRRPLLAFAGAVALLVYGCRQDAGVAIAFVSDRTGDADIYVVNTDGSGLRNITADPAEDSSPSWSPDGRRLAFKSSREDRGDIWTVDVRTGAVARVTQGDGHKSQPAWSPDGQRIAFVLHHPRSMAVLATIASDGSDQRELTVRTSDHPSMWPRPQSFVEPEWPTWSPDGQRIAFHATSDTNTDIYVLDIGSGAVTRLTDHPNADWQPAWSPRGDAIAFTSRRDGTDEIYTMSLDGGSVRNLTRLACCSYEAAWSPDGNTIAFKSARHDDTDIYAVDVGGANRRKITNSAHRDWRPAWRPATAGR
jgi:Tol biopolymer transport system component